MLILEGNGSKKTSNNIRENQDYPNYLQDMNFDDVKEKSITNYFSAKGIY
jgi:hypothetical protein